MAARSDFPVESNLAATDPLTFHHSSRALDNCSRYTIYPLALLFSQVVLHGLEQTSPLEHWMFAWKGELSRVNHCIEVDASCYHFLGKKSTFWGYSGIDMHVPLMPFCTFATNDVACPWCLVASLAETAGACCQMLAACSRCPAPSLGKTAGAYCPTICSMPAMSSALVGQDCWGLLSIRLARPLCQCLVAQPPFGLLLKD